MKKKVLLLGATGRIGPSLLEEYKKNYAEHYDLILGTRGKAVEGFKVVNATLDDFEGLKKAFADMDVVINLAGNSDEKDEIIEDFIGPNIRGVYNVFEAARQVGVKRVIQASSVHAVRGYDLDYEVKAGDAPKPVNLYGATKAFLEALTHVYSAKYGMSCFAIRIGAYIADEDLESVCPVRKNYDYVISQRDFGHLLDCAIMAPDSVKYGILPGISKNKKRNMKLEEAHELVGYSPKDDSFLLCKVMEKE